GRLHALDDVQAVKQLDTTARRACENRLDRMRLRRTARREPAATLGRQDQRAAALAEKCEPARLGERSIPELEREAEVQRCGQPERIADEAELRQAFRLDP